MAYTRFSKTERIDYNGVNTYGRWKPYRFLTTKLPDSSIGVFEVTASFAGRPDLIAYSLYGVSQLDWVLLAFNNIRETLNWPQVGDLIRYPVDSVVLQEVYQ